MPWSVINWKLSILNFNGHAYSHPLPPLWRWGIILVLNGIERVIIHLSVPENYGFDTIILNIFKDRPSFKGARCAHKRHHGYNYSYHGDQNLNKSWFDTNVGLPLFLHVTPFQPTSISLISIYLNGIGKVVIILEVPKNYEFHTNVGRLRLFLQKSCTYDLANDTAQNNLNRIHVFC